MDFKIVDLYTFLIELAFCILFLIIFTSIHYSLNNVKKIRLGLEKNKIGRFFYFFIFGALLASLSFVVSWLCTKGLQTNIGLPIIILGLIFTLSFFYDIAVGLGSIIPSFMWVILTYGFETPEAQWNLVARLLVIVIYVGVSFALHLYKEKKWTYFILGSITIAGTIVVCLSTVENVNILYYGISTTFSIALTFIFLGLIKWINRIFTNVTNMAIKSVYDNKHYLIPESLEQNFNYYIKNNHINQALVILFEFSHTNNDLVKQQLLDNIYNAFDKSEYKTLFFKTEYNKYGLVLSSKDFYINNLYQCFRGNSYDKRLENDNLFKLQTILKSITLKYKHFNQTYNFKLKAYASVYGVHSYDINELINDDMFMINNEDDTTPNIVKVFNSVMTEHITSDAIDYATLTQNINLDELTVSLELVRLNNSYKKFVYPRVFWIRKLLGDYKSIVKTLPIKAANTLLRNLAIKSIELYAQSEYKGKYDLIINYPWEELNTVFYSISNSISKIKLFGVEPNNIVYCFDVEEVKEWPKNVLVHLTEFEDRDVKYILLNVNSPTVFNSHKPLFVTISNQAIKSSKKLDKIMKLVKKQNINVLSTNDK